MLTHFKSVVFEVHNGAFDNVIPYLKASFISIYQDVGMFIWMFNIVYIKNNVNFVSTDNKCFNTIFAYK